MRNICTICGQELTWWDRAQGRFDHPDCREHSLEKQIEKLKLKPLAAPPASMVKSALATLRPMPFNRLAPQTACDTVPDQVRPAT
jgi:hypothetical protein